MQENIKVLTVKRDRLKKFMETSVPVPETYIDQKNDQMNVLPNTVSISFCDGGIQILINSCLIEDGFPLAGVLKEISKEGLNVINCTCTKIKQRLIHSIQSEVNSFNCLKFPCIKCSLVMCC